MTLLLGFSAVNTGNNLLYLLVSALLGFMAVSGLLGQQNLNRLDVDIDQPDEAYAGLPTLVRVHLRNRRHWLPGFLLRLEVADGSTLFPVVAGNCEVSRPLSLTPTRRGYQDLPPVWVSSRFPINFFIRSRRLPGQARVLVLPAPRKCLLEFAGSVEISGTESELRQPGSSGELQSIGDYHGMEPLKEIHWKLSARHNELKVKRLSSQGRRPVVLDLDKMPGRNLEERLGHCCFLVNRLLRRQQPVGLQLRDRRIPAGLGHPHRLRLLRELALYDQY